jgi:hypothetical protein
VKRETTRLGERGLEVVAVPESEIRISKLETNSNDQNTNDQNNPAWFKFVLDFGHCSFDIVSDFACLAEAFTRRWVLRISVSPGSGLNWKLNSMI